MEFFELCKKDIVAVSFCEVEHVCICEVKDGCICEVRHGCIGGTKVVEDCDLWECAVYVCLRTDGMVCELNGLYGCGTGQASLSHLNPLEGGLQSQAPPEKFQAQLWQEDYLKGWSLSRT